MAAQAAWEWLSELWMVLSPRGQTLALISPVHAEGVVAPLYRRRELAEAAVARAGAELAVQPVPSLWQVARLLAEQGYAGLLLDEQLPLFFVTTEPGSSLPTHVALAEGDELRLLGEAGATPLRAADVQPWRDLAAFDRLAGRRLLRDRVPFYGYDPSAPLFEIVAGGEPLRLAETGALLASGAAEEAVALFSDGYAAEWYASERLAPARPNGRVQVLRHANVVARLDSLAAALPPRSALLLNPGRHRFYQGFFRRAGADWYLATINGLWRVEPPFRCTQVARRT